MQVVQRREQGADARRQKEPADGPGCLERLEGLVEEAVQVAGARAAGHVEGVDDDAAGKGAARGPVGFVDRGLRACGAEGVERFAKVCVGLDYFWALRDGQDDFFVVAAACGGGV